jgi:hypothetical protein
MQHSRTPQGSSNWQQRYAQSRSRLSSSNANNSNNAQKKPSKARNLVRVPTDKYAWNAFSKQATVSLGGALFWIAMHMPISSCRQTRKRRKRTIVDNEHKLKSAAESSNNSPRIWQLDRARRYSELRKTRERARHRRAANAPSLQRSGAWPYPPCTREPQACSCSAQCRSPK